jgi:hypothetical protein
MADEKDPKVSKQPDKSPEELQKALNRLSESQGEYVKRLEREAEELEKVQKLSEKNIESYNKRALAIQNELDLEEKRIKVWKEQLKLRGNLTDEEQEAVAAAEKAHQIKKDTIKTGEDMMENLFGLKSAQEKLNKAEAFRVGNLKNLWKGMKSNLSMATVLTAGMGKMTSVIDAGIKAVVMATINLALAQDEVIGKFKATTGAGNQYNVMMTQMQRDVAFSGVTMEETGEALTGLYSKMSAFTHLSTSEQRNLLKTTSLLGEFGISAELTAQNLDFATRSMGMTGTEAEFLLRDLKSTADALQMPPAEIAQAFAAASPILARHGKDMMKVFDGMAKHAKETGIGVEQLLGLMAKFDQFDSAGQAVGRLNAILGGPYLNSIDMLNATEEERIDILKRSIDMAGVQFDQLGRFEKMAIADALGMSVDEAGRIFGAATVEMEKQALAQEKLELQASKVQSIMQQLKSAFAALIIDMRPLIEEYILPFVDSLRDMATGADGAGDRIGAFIEKIRGFADVAGWIFLGVGLLAAAAQIWPVAVPAIMTGVKLLGLSWAAGKAMDAGGAAQTAVRQANLEPGGEGGAAPGAAAPSRRNVVRMQHGGVVAPPRSALTVVGEAGPELMELPVGTRVTPAPATKELTDSITLLTKRIDKMSRATTGAETPVVIKIGEREFGRTVLSALNRNTSALLTSS